MAVDEGSPVMTYAQCLAITAAILSVGDQVAAAIYNTAKDRGDSWIDIDDEKQLAARARELIEAAKVV